MPEYASYMCCSCFDFSPWDEGPYKDAAERTDRGEISLNGFLSQVCAPTVFDSCNVREYFYQFPTHTPKVTDYG